MEYDFTARMAGLKVLDYPSFGGGPWPSTGSRFPKMKVPRFPAWSGHRFTFSKPMMMALYFNPFRSNNRQSATDGVFNGVFRPPFRPRGVSRARVARAGSTTMPARGSDYPRIGRLAGLGFHWGRSNRPQAVVAPKTKADRASWRPSRLIW